MSSSDSGSEDEQAAVQHVTGANADPQVLQYFWDLASLQQDEREAAAQALVVSLVDSQSQYDDKSRAPDAQPSGNLEQQASGNRQQRMEQSLNCCSPLMAYGLKRLSRGLASSRQGARQGFAAALAATLAHSAAAAAGQSSTPLKQPCLSAAGALVLLEACLEITGAMSGADQRDALLGRVFGLAALARSGLATSFPAADVSSCNLRGVAVVASQLVGLLQRKSFLRESAAAALVELLQDLSTQQMEQALSQAPQLSTLIQTSPASANPELLFLALRLWHNLPHQQLQRCQLLPKLPAGGSPPPQQFWLQPSAVERSAVACAAAAVFSAEHVQKLVPCLLATSGSHPRLHPVWGCLLALLVPGFVPVKQPEDQPASQTHHRRAAPEPQQLTNLWHNFIDAACFSSTHERKALALQLLQLLLPVLTPDTVGVLLSKPLLGCLGPALRNKDSYLHATAKKCMARLTTCVDHSLLTHDNPALAAKLQLMIAAALQSANLGQYSNSSKGAKGQQQQLLSGMDAAGVGVYVDQLLQEFVAAAAAAAGAGAVEAGESEGSGDEEMQDADAGVNDSKVKQLLDQLTAALKFPEADSTTLRKGIYFLAAAAYLDLPKSLDASAVAAAAAASRVSSAGVGSTAAAAAQDPASSKKAKKAKHNKGEKAAAAAAAAAVAGGVADQDQQAVEQALQLAGGIQPQLPRLIRQHCGSRLITLLNSLKHRTGQQQQQQQKGKQQQQQAGAESAAAAGDESKKQKRSREQQEQEQAAAAARLAAAQQHEALTCQILAFVTAAMQQDGVQCTVDEDVAEMVQQLHQLETAVVQHTQQQQQGGTSAAAAAALGSSSRSKACIQLIQQLQLQLLSGGLSAEAAGSVVDDLEVAVVRGLGMPDHDLGIDRSAPDLIRFDDEESNSQSDREDDESSDADEDDPAWQDVLLDLLLALLSSSSDAAAAKAGGVLVPTAPLREVCEAVFRAFAEDITAQGLSDMIRILGQRASEIIKPRTDEDDEMEGNELDSDSDNEESDHDDVASDLDVRSDHADLADLEQIAPGSGSEDSGSHEQEDDQADLPAQQPTAAAAANTNAITDDQNDDHNDDQNDDQDDDQAASDLDDDAMLAMDAQLGAAVRSMLARSGGSAKDRAAALLSHQLRVAALLEEWIKKCPKSPLLVQIILPLLQALITASGAGGNPTLADRLTSIINKHLSRCRPLLPAAAAAAGSSPAAAAARSITSDSPQWDLQLYESDLRKILYHASRDKDPRIAAAAAQALLVLLAAGGQAGGAAAAAAQVAAAAAFNDFFDKKKSRLQRQWIEQVVSRCPEAVIAGDGGALTAVLNACSKGRNEATRIKAVLLLPLCFRGSQQQVVLAALQQQQLLLAAALGAAVAGPYKAKDQHAAAVKAVVQVLVAVEKLSGGKRLADVLGGEVVRELGKVVVVVKAAGVAPKVEAQLERLVETAGLQQLVAANKPDPARLAVLKKARAALEGHKEGHKPTAADSTRTPAAVPGGGGKVEVQQKQKQQQQEEQQQDGVVLKEGGQQEKKKKKQRASGKQKGKSQHKGKDTHETDKAERPGADMANGGGVLLPSGGDSKQQKPSKQSKQQKDYGGVVAAVAAGKKRRDEVGKGHSSKKHKK